ncbi:MAG: lipid-A-disaccharide synthase [Scytonematopsis contorta HA4267-MV1]|jgi:lipid-A-disaccharide synthase|nr:lipid-A-disaccharide synthase [Scytonematopsis contorta HA4267-MV1]
MTKIDILILSNGPGEVTTWVRPVVKALRQKLGDDRDKVRISVVLSPCPNASGKEVDIALSYPEVDRVQGAEHFLSFLVFGKTNEHWDWRNQGVIVFLGGEPFFPVVIGKRLGYRTVVYAEWEARWHGLVDCFAIMKKEVATKVKQKYSHKFTVVGDLIAEAGNFSNGLNTDVRDKKQTKIIGILPGSKAAKLAQGAPLTLAIAEYVYLKRPETKFVLPLAPTLDSETLASFADPGKNPIAKYFGDISAKLVESEPNFLETGKGMQVELYTKYPAYEVLSQCSICLTTVGANTAELGSLGVPMIVLLPTQQLDAMRAWDGLPGLLANLPGVGSSFAKLINWFFLQRKGLLAWPNIWAQEEIVPELVGKLDPKDVGEMVLDYLENPEKLQQVREKLQSVRGSTGAADKIAELVSGLLTVDG